MVGQISGSGSRFIYIESIYDTRKGEAKTTELRADCTLVAKTPSSSSASEENNSMRTFVQTQKEGGTFLVPVLINGAITLNFTIDSGAADVSIPIDVVITLMRTGTLSNSDFLGNKTYTLADGRSTPSETFRIRSLKVGDKVLENITASVAPVEGSLLLGQSFLSQFKTWSFDNQRQLLILE
jgi:clan AA aspartic protease (TIGR02281 family)